MCVCSFCFVFLACYHHHVNTLVFIFTTIKIVSLTLIFSPGIFPGLSLLQSQPLLRVFLLLSAFTFSLQDHSGKGKLLLLCSQHQKRGPVPIYFISIGESMCPTWAFSLFFISHNPQICFLGWNPNQQVMLEALQQATVHT